MNMNDRYVKARHLVATLKSRYWSSISNDQNITGAAFGRRTAHNERTDEPALVFYVLRKTPSRFLPLSRLLPRRMYIGGDCVEVDVVETGPLYPFSFTSRERPAPSGISVGPPVIGGTISAGTLGSLVTDLTDQSTCILSCNHVLANENAASIGDPILQPGSFDGGTDPNDRVATLKRFQTINATGNIVDCAIAQVVQSDAPLVIDQMQSTLMPTATPKHPAVGLLFAGGCNRTLLNPIDNVLSALNIQFLAGAGSTITADVGMNVEKVGRTTEYTTSTISEIDVSATITYNFGPGAFVNQIATMWMSNPGDSGSVVCSGGAGSATDQCSCGTTSSASGVLGVDLKPEQAMALQVRDKFLRHTLIGRYGIDLFYLNEERFLARFQRADVKQEDKELARSLYKKYIGEARQAFAEGENSERRISDQHIEDARNALRHGQKFMSKEEVAASDNLFELAVRHGKGKNAREILTLLNDESLLGQIKEITAPVKSVRKEEGGRCGD
jgi:hypothetical protein